MLSNTALKYYDGEVLRLQKETRSQYHAQVDRLIAKLSTSVKDKTKIKITKVVKAGSFAKFTILRKSVDDPVDVDVVFYISGRSLDSSSFESLSADIYDLLIELYPSKAVDDFEIQKRAATVVFKGSGLAVDIVPVIESGSSGYGFQFDTQGGKTKTCAPCQIDFVRARKNVDANYRTLVRMGKKWKNYKEIPGLKSFHVELILAYLQDRDGASVKIEQRLRDFFLFIAQNELKTVLSFPENKGTITAFTDPVVIIDPVNNDNNTAGRITDDERKTIVTAANEAWEIANHASVEGDTDIWKELFGPRFKIED